MTAAAVSAVPTRRYEIPVVTGEPDAARALAAAYRDLADAVQTAARRTTDVMRGLDATWSGSGRQATAGPLDVLVRDAIALTRALRQGADDLDAYASKLAAAHHHHRWSLHRLLKVGAVVAVSATAIVVTMGAAGVVEAAAAGAAVEAATEAAGAAAAADSAAAGGLLAALEPLGSLQPLLRFALPQLTSATWSMGAVATWDEATAGRLDGRSLALAAALTVGGTVVSAKVLEAVGGPAWLQHVGQGAVWSGVDATGQEVQTGSVDPVAVAESFVLSGGGSALHDELLGRGVLFHEPDYRRAALLDALHRPGRIVDVGTAFELATVRQTLADIEAGSVDLRVQEGPGHTIAKHVGRHGVWLLQRVRAERRPLASSYFTETDATHHIAEVLRRNRREIDAWLATDPSPKETLGISSRFNQDVGMLVNRKGLLRFSRRAMVVVGRDAYGLYVVTSYPGR